MKHSKIEMKENLINALTWNPSEDNLVKLEREAQDNYVFVNDNGKKIVRRNSESLGAFIDRYSVSLMTNFSREKYETLKRLCFDYNKYGDSKLCIETPVMESKKSEGIIQRIILNTFGFRKSVKAH